MQDDTLYNLFVVAYGMGKNRDSMASFSDRCLIAEMMRFSYQYTPESGKKISVLDLGKPYCNKQGASLREMLFHIAAGLKHRLKLLLLKAGFFGVAMDEATDIAMDQGLILYLKFVVALTCL